MSTINIIRIILTIILILFPMGLLFYYFFDSIKRTVIGINKKIQNVKAIDKMRKDLLRQRAKETKQDTSYDEKNTNNMKDSVVMMVENLEKTNKINMSEKDYDISGKNDQFGGASDHSDNDVGSVSQSLSESQQLRLNEREKQERKQKLEKILYEADVFKKDGKLEDYEKKLIEGLAIDIENIELNRRLAEYYFNIGNHKKSLSLLKKVIEIESEDHYSIWHVGQIYLINKDYHTAEILVEKAINLNSTNPKYHISMVEVLYNTDRKVEAIGIMEKVVKLRPSNTNYLVALAELYEEMDDLDGAKKYYFRVLENEPGHELAKKKIQS